MLKGGIMEIKMQTLVSLVMPINIKKAKL